MTARAIMWATLLVADAAVAVDVAVLPVVGPAPPAERSALTTALRAELAALGVDVQPGDVTDRTLADAATFGADCAVTDATCALQLGGVAGVDRVVVAALDGGRLVVRLHDVDGQRELRRVTVPSSSATPQKTARLGAVRLIAPERETGTLTLQGQAGARVLVDGVERGTTPLAPLALPPGTHTLTVAPPGEPARTIGVEVVFDEVTNVDVRAGAPTRRTGLADTVYVLDALVDGYPPLTAALLTATAQDALAGRPDLVVVPPDTVTRVVDRDTLTALQACRDDDCAIAALRSRFQQGDVLFVDVEQIGTGSRLSLRRRSLTPERRTSDDVIARISPVDVDGRVAAAAIGDAVAQIYPRADDAHGGLLPDRFDPPPLAIPWLAAPTTIAIVGTAAAIVGGVMLAGAPTPEAQTAMLATTIGGVVAATGGVVGAVVMVPLIDWDDLQGDNAKLLQTRADRPTTRQ